MFKNNYNLGVEMVKQTQEDAMARSFSAFRLANNNR
jgi:hypothetical protein